MYPVNDVVCNLLETPFRAWKDEDKKDVLNCGRPTESLEICIEKEIKKTGRSYKINFKKSWFTDFKWLCSSRNLQKLFCWPCLLFSSKSNVWNKQGFGDFQNITRSLHKHEDSVEHLKCRVRLKTFEKSRNTIADAVQENERLCTHQFNENVRLNRLFMQLVVDAVLYLNKEQLAFRRHHEVTNQGNFKELLALLISKSSLEIQNHYNKIKNTFSGNSKTIQNELIDCISEYIQDQVKTEIGDTRFFSLQVDDATDIFQRLQCSVILRFVNSQGTLVERLLGFYDVSADRSAVNMFDLLDSILKELGYENKLVAQCYDGASVMPGHLNDLEKRIKDKAPQAAFVHCMGHHLNLVLQQSCKKISECRTFFASVNGIPSFFHHSVKRTEFAVARRIPAVAEVRWSSNSRLLRVIVEEWDKLKQVFELILNDEASDDKSIRLCKGFLSDMNNFQFTVLAVVFNDIFGLTDVLFDVLQKKSLDTVFCTSKIKLTCDLINNKRNEQHFSALFEKSKTLTSVTLQRINAASSEDEIYLNCQSLYYEIVDNILLEMQVRFEDCDKLQFLSLADATKFEEYAENFPSTALQNLQQCYPNIFSKIQRLKNELSLIYADESHRNVTTENILQTLQENKDVFEETYKLFCLVLTIPSTSASVQSFSRLMRLRTFIKNTTSQERLSSLTNITIHQELLSTLIERQPFYEDIIDKFAALKEQSIDLIYKK